MTAKTCQNLFLSSIFFFLFFSGCKIGVNNPSSNCLEGSKKISSEFKTTGIFNSINFKSGGVLILSQSREPSVNVETDDNLLQYVIATTTDSVLEIKNSVSICPSKLKVNVSLPYLSKVTLSGSGNISGNQSLNLTDFEIIDSSSGNIDLEGTGHSGLLRLDGSGNINALGIETTVSTAILNGSGNIQVYAKDRLTAVINGSGNIYYKGNPLEKIFTVNGSGHIIQLTD